MSFTSMILNSKNEIEEVSNSEIKFIEAVDTYVAVNAERLANLPEYQALERGQRGKYVCKQIRMAAEKGEREFDEVITKSKKLLDANLGNEVNRYQFVDEVKQSFKTPFGKVALAFFIPAFLFWGLSKVQPSDAVVNASIDAGTTAIEVQADDLKS